jgi:rhodanese-related sulfurtransferase
MEQLIAYVAQNTLLVAATVLAFVAVVLFEFRLRSRSGLEVNVVQAVRMINNGANVVDIRPRERYDAGHIVDALNIPPDELAKGEEGKLKKKRGVLVVCDNGTESYRCAKALQDKGFSAAFSLQGGLAAWQRENQLLVPSRK